MVRKRQPAILRGNECETFLWTKCLGCFGRFPFWDSKHEIWLFPSLPGTLHYNVVSIEIPLKLNSDYVV